MTKVKSARLSLAEMESAIVPISRRISTMGMASRRSIAAVVYRLGAGGVGPPPGGVVGRGPGGVGPPPGGVVGRGPVGVAPPAPVGRVAGRVAGGGVGVAPGLG